MSEYDSNEDFIKDHVGQYPAWQVRLQAIREDMDDHMGMIDDEVAELRPDLPLIETQTRRLIVDAERMLAALRERGIDGS